MTEWPLGAHCECSDQLTEDEVAEAEADWSQKWQCPRQQDHRLCPLWASHWHRETPQISLPSGLEWSFSWLLILWQESFCVALCWQCSGISWWMSILMKDRPYEIPLSSWKTVFLRFHHSHERPSLWDSCILRKDHPYEIPSALWKSTTYLRDRYPQERPSIWDSIISMKDWPYEIPPLSWKTILMRFRHPHERPFLWDSTIFMKDQS